MQTFGVLKELMKHHHHTYGLVMGGANRSTEAQKLSKGELIYIWYLQLDRCCTNKILLYNFIPLKKRYLSLRMGCFLILSVQIDYSKSHKYLLIS